MAAQTQVRVYRNPARIVALTLAAVAAGGFFGFAAVVTSSSSQSVVGNTALAAMCAAVALRLPFTRVTATAAGMRVIGVLGPRFYSWRQVKTVGDSIGSFDGGLIPVLAPVLHLHDGRTVILDPAGGYRAATARRRAQALERLRRHYTSTPTQSVGIMEHNG